MMTSSKGEIWMFETKPIQYFRQGAWPVKSRSKNVHPLEGAILDSSLVHIKTAGVAAPHLT
jgi:hypothetical protein